MATRKAVGYTILTAAAATGETEEQYQARQRLQADEARWRATGVPPVHMREATTLKPPARVSEFYAHMLNGGGVLMLGAAGTGKTLTAAFLAKFMTTIAEPRRQTLYMRWHDVAERMRREFDEDGDREGTEIRRLSQTPCLIVDEFHINEQSPWQLTQATRLIDDRWAAQRPTVFIANLTPEKMQEQLGQANWSRLTSSWCKRAVLSGPDRRKGGAA